MRVSTRKSGPQASHIKKDFENYIQFVREKARRATFKTWIFFESSPCGASKLAEAGFIFVGNKHEPDAVRCFLCQKHLDSWEADDNPWREHLKHSPNCAFAKLGKPEMELTLEQFINIENEMVRNFVKKLEEDALRDLNRSMEMIKNELNIT